jgi:uncharacterized protein HemX
MTTQQSAGVSVAALVANLAVGAATLSYVRDTEHRLTQLESALQQHDCRFDVGGCTIPPKKE